MIISSISSFKGRWGDKVKMNVDGLADGFKVILGGVECEIVSVNDLGNQVSEIEWIVPEVLVGENDLYVDFQLPKTFPLDADTICKTGNNTSIIGSSKVIPCVFSKIIGRL